MSAKSIISTLFWEIAETALVLYAVLSSHVGAENVVVFIANLHLLLSLPMLVLAFASGKLEPERRPSWLLKTVSYCDFSRAIVFAWFGWWFCAWAFLIGFIASALFREKALAAAKASTATTSTEAAR